MQKTYVIYLVVTLITSSGSNERNDEHFVTINGEIYDISPTQNHIPSENIPKYNLSFINNSSLTSPNSDAFVDLILAGARKLIKTQGLDPAKLPDAIAKFSKKILGIKVWGEAKVKFFI